MTHIASVGYGLKRLGLTVMALLFAFSLKALTFDVNLKAVCLEKIKLDSKLYVQKGEEIFIRSMTLNPDEKTVLVYKLLVDYKGEEHTFNCSDFSKELPLEISYSNKEEFWLAKFIKESSGPLSQKRNSYLKQEDMDNAVTAFEATVNSGNCHYENYNLERYIYSLMRKIVPSERYGLARYNISLLMVSDKAIPTTMLPNGTLVLNTSLLAEMGSESEFVAALAQHLSHFYLDHAIVNKMKSDDKSVTSSFMNMFQNGLSFAESAITKTNFISKGASLQGSISSYISGGSLALSQDQVEMLKKSAGTNYTEEQMVSAGHVSKYIIKELKYDEKALESMYKRKLEFNMLDNNMIQVARLKKEINANKELDSLYIFGDKVVERDTTYEKMVFDCISMEALHQLEDGRFKTALFLVERNIGNGKALVSDYMVKAYCLAGLDMGSSSYEQAIECLHKAEDLAHWDSEILKHEVNLSVFYGHLDNAAKALEKYRAIEKDDTWAELMEIRLRLYAGYSSAK